MTQQKATPDRLPQWPRLLRPTLAAAYIGVSPGLLRQLELPTVKVRSLRLYDRDALDRWIDSLDTNAPATEIDSYLSRLE